MFNAQRLTFFLLCVIRSDAMTEHEKAEQIECANNVSNMVSQTFCKAYHMRAAGTSKAAILIDYDITAAGELTDDAANRKLVKIGRNTVIAANAAFEDSIPFAVAHAYLMARLHEDIAELIRSDDVSLGKKHV